jgi:hypothetical protein
MHRSKNHFLLDHLVGAGAAKHGVSAPARGYNSSSSFSGHVIEL